MLSCMCIIVFSVSLFDEFCTLQNVIASALNANTLNGFNLELPNLHPVRNMPNYWVNQAFHIDPLEEARKMFDKLEST